MALNIRIDRSLPGYGVGLKNDTVYLNAGIALSGTGQQSVGVLPSTSTWNPGFSTFKFRCKVYNGAGTSPTLTDLALTASDGTNTVTIWVFHPNAAVTLSTTSWFDSGPIDCIVDTAASGNGGGAVGQLIAPTSSAAGGVTSLTLKTTLGGTSPAATLDMEVVPLIPS